MKRVKRENILVIADTHIPFEHRNYLGFCRETYNKHHCNRVVHSGDLVDNCAINYYEKDPDGKGPEEEMSEADKHLVEWFKAFPKLLLCIGNHDMLVDRKAKSAGLPKRTFKKYRDIWDLPRSWREAWSWELDDVLFKHGTNFSGKNCHIAAAYDSRQSTVIGHVHSVAGVSWSANDKDCIFGMAVGCGIDRKKYAFNYGLDSKAKPILGCGIVSNNGSNAQFIPMDLGKKVIYMDF